MHLAFKAHIGNHELKGIGGQAEGKKAVGVGGSAAKSSPLMNVGSYQRLPASVFSNKAADSIDLGRVEVQLFPK